MIFHTHSTEMGCIREKFNSVPSIDRLGHRGDRRDDSAKILFQSCLQEALVSRSGMGRDVCSLMWSIQHFLCQWRRRPPSKVPWRMVLVRPLWCVTCQIHASYCLLTAASRGSCQPKRKLILLSTQSLVLHSKRRRREVSSGAWCWKPGSFLQSQWAGSMFHSGRRGWRWQETCRAWTCLWSWCRCTTRSCSVWPLLRAILIRTSAEQVPSLRSMCYWGNMGMEWTRNKSQHTKLTLCQDSNSLTFDHESSTLTNKLSRHEYTSLMSSHCLHWGKNLFCKFDTKAVGHFIYFKTTSFFPPQILILSTSYTAQVLLLPVTQHKFWEG